MGSSPPIAMPALGARITRTLGDIDPLNKVPFKRATSRVQKGPLSGVSLVLPRKLVPNAQEASTIRLTDTTGLRSVRRNSLRIIRKLILIIIVC